MSGLHSPCLIGYSNVCFSMKKEELSNIELSTWKIRKRFRFNKQNFGPFRKWGEEFSDFYLIMSSHSSVSQRDLPR